MKYIEISHRMIPGKEPFPLELKIYDVRDILPEVHHPPESWYVISVINMWSHVGTHIEFPYHHWKDGADAASFPLSSLIGDGVVLDFHKKQTGEEITLDDLKAQKNRIKEHDIIFIRTDKDKLYRTPNWNDQPYITNQAIEWLCETFKPKVIGTDAAGFEVPNIDQQPNHISIFKRGIAMVESATNLAAVGNRRVKFYILPMPIEGLDACPVRILVEVMEE